MMTRASLVLAALLVALPAGAASPGMRFAQKAERLFLKKQYAEAVEQYRQAEAAGLLPPEVRIVRWQIARSLEEAGANADALTAFEAYLAVEEDAERQKEARAHIANLELLTFGAIAVECASGYQVSLNQEAPAPCPILRRRLPPGQYAVTLHNASPDLAWPTQTIELAAGPPTTVTFAEPSRAIVESRVVDRALEISVDGVAVGPAPRTIVLPPGEHAFTGTAGKRTWTEKRTLEPGTVTTLVLGDAGLDVDEGPSYTPAVMLTLASAAALAAGGWYASQYFADTESDQASQQQLLAGAFLGGGAVLGGLAIWKYVSP
ncbi:MAG: hypothetical protein R3F60_12490 [bacterium]